MADFGASGAIARRMGSLGSIAASHADGSEFPAEASFSQFKVRPHAYYTAIIRDVSERTRIIAELRASEERERTHAKDMQAMLFAVPADVCIAHDHRKPAAYRLVQRRGGAPSVSRRAAGLCRIVEHKMDFSSRA